LKLSEQNRTLQSYRCLGGWNSSDTNIHTVTCLLM